MPNQGCDPEIPKDNAPQNSGAAPRPLNDIIGEIDFESGNPAAEHLPANLPHSCLGPDWGVRVVNNKDELAQVASLLAHERLISLELSFDCADAERPSLLQIGLPRREESIVFDLSSLSDLSGLQSALKESTNGVVLRTRTTTLEHLRALNLNIPNTIDLQETLLSLTPSLAGQSSEQLGSYLLGLQFQQRSDEEQAPHLDAHQRLAHAGHCAEIVYKIYEALAELNSKATLTQELDVESAQQELSKTLEAKAEILGKKREEFLVLEIREAALRKFLERSQEKLQ